ncbi:MAG: lysophospholipid acyltransferase family protein [Gammaproteobacteria bacterium]
MGVIAAKLLLQCLARLPLSVSHRLGSLLGWCLTVLPNRTRRTAWTNICLCLPTLSLRERRRVLSQSLVETGKTLMETGAMWLWDCERLLPLVSKVEGEDAVQQAFEQGQGVIFLTPHLGSWEIAGLYAAARYPMTILYRPPRLAGLDYLLRRARSRSGAKLVTTNTAGVRTLFRTLNEGGVLGILPDQEPPKDGGIFAPFFGIPAYTMVLVARLVQRTRAPVFIAYCERLGGSDGFHLHFQPIPDPLMHDTVEASVAAVNQAVEQCVRLLPTQYQWGYKRFRRRPPGEPQIYGAPAGP